MNTNPTTAELAILSILWKRETATVREVHEIINESTRNDEPILAKTESKPKHVQAQFGHPDSNVHCHHNIFTKVETESPHHPFFNRVWMVRHVLDADSPLLLDDTRERLKRNNGYWPQELNNPNGIRASVQFDTLLVSFSGTLNADAGAVFAHHVYNYGDISVGYSFCNMLYQNVDDECIRVNMSLLNDVTEQNGGGGEASGSIIPLHTTNVNNKELTK